MEQQQPDYEKMLSALADWDGHVVKGAFVDGEKYCALGWLAHKAGASRAEVYGHMSREDVLQRAYGIVEPGHVRYGDREFQSSVMDLNDKSRTPKDAPGRIRRFLQALRDGKSLTEAYKIGRTRPKAAPVVGELVEAGR